jgi:hypothetical protein
MKRFYYISDDLDDLEQIEHELEAGGIARPQIYLLSNDDVGLDNHDVNRVASFLKTDVIHSVKSARYWVWRLQAVILAGGPLFGHCGAGGLGPFIFLAIIGFGFATWEAGFIGMQAPTFISPDLKKRWSKAGTCCLLRRSGRSEKLKKVIKQHPKLERAGTEVTHTGLLMWLLRNWESLGVGR